MNAHLTIVLLVTLLLAPAAASAAAPCEAPDLVGTLGEIGDSDAVRIEREGDRLVVRDVARDQVVLVATRDSLEVAGPADAPRPDKQVQPVTRVVRDALGRRLYSHTTTPLGARVTVFAPGVLGRHGLHVIAFDNDDVHLADARGKLLYQRRTGADGTLVQRDGRCERRAQPDGRIEISPAR